MNCDRMIMNRSNVCDLIGCYVCDILGDYLLVYAEGPNPYRRPSNMVVADIVRGIAPEMLDISQMYEADCYYVYEFAVMTTHTRANPNETSKEFESWIDVMLDILMTADPQFGFKETPANYDRDDGIEVYRTSLPVLFAACLTNEPTQHEIECGDTRGTHWLVDYGPGSYRRAVDYINEHVVRYLGDGITEEQLSEMEYRRIWKAAAIYYAHKHGFSRDPRWNCFCDNLHYAIMSAE